MNNNIRVLIVDDSSVMRKIVERSLRQSGIQLAEVFEAGNGEDALKLLAAKPVDLVLSDINMPVMDGLEMVRRLPEVSCHAPVVMITTEAGEAQVMEALAHGAAGYIRKPFTPEQVREHVVPLLGE